MVANMSSNKNDCRVMMDFASNTQPLSRAMIVTSCLCLSKDILFNRIMYIYTLFFFFTSNETHCPESCDFSVVGIIPNMSEVVRIIDVLSIKHFIHPPLAYIHLPSKCLLLKPTRPQKSWYIILLYTCWLPEG